MTTLLTGSHLIAGVPSRAGGDAFTATDPRTRAPLEPVYADATRDEIEQAAQAARAAFAETRLYSAARLAAFLERAASEIEALGDQLLETADRETGLGIPRLTGERARTTGQLRKFAGLLREGSYVEAIVDGAQPDRQPAPRPSIRRMLIPIGPVAVFSASNFPLAFSVAGGDTASAFAAGCPVIVKAHPSHPATSELTAAALTRAVAAEGFPAGFFSLLHGARVDTAQALVTHPAIAAVGFTGSLRAGRAIFNAAAARPVPIPVYAEMGSVNPLVILPGALAERSAAIASGLADSVTLGSGQFCTNPGLVFVIESAAAQAFIAQFVDEMRQRQPGVLLNANVEQGLAQAVAGTLARPGVQALTGGAPIEAEGFCYPHTVLLTTSDTFRADPALQTEHFGPVTLIVRCDSFDDLLATVEQVEGNLTASVHAANSEMADAARLYSALREKVGRLIWNGYPTGVEVVYAMQHGGPYPATTAPHSTSVGLTAIKRFMRPIAFQNFPDALLPDALKDGNPLGIWRIVNEQWTK